MKLYHWVAYATCFAFVVAGCNDSPIGDDFADKHYGANGAIVIPSNVENGFFDLANPDTARIAFDVEAKGEAVSSADVIATHTSGATAVFMTVSTFPQTIDVPLDDLLSVLGLTMDDAKVGDDVLFTFRSQTTTGTYESNETLAIPFSCNSDLAGELSYVTTGYFCTGDALSGDVEMTELGAGKYTFSDWTFGSYTECYGAPPSGSGTLQFEDVCNQIDITGEDGYGDGWAFIVNAVDGVDMTITWSNDYGEFGTTVLTRKDGLDWPGLSN